MISTQYIGKSLSRVDGIAKVTGQATYAGEFNVPDLAYGYMVNSTIANGKITAIDTETAKAVEGVIEVFTHLNIPDSVKFNADYTDPLSPPGHPFRPLYNDNILYNGQPIALVVAESFEIARYAAGLIEATYEAEDCTTDITKNLDKATTEDVDAPPENRGDASAAYKKAAYQMEATYFQPRHYHNPMEPHASIALWDAEEEAFTIYDKIQGVGSSQAYICGIFDLPKQKVRVKSPFVGGGFGSGLRPQYQLFMATMAAKALNRSVKVSMTRAQMFSFGHRPANLQKLKLGANQQGKLTAIQHESYGETSTFEKYSEMVVNWSGLMYDCENVSMKYQLVPVNVYTPMDMRGPGGTTGMFALECAIDEIAEKAGIDPLEFRLRNYAEKDQLEDKPFSSKALKECYQQAAKRFGWNKRPENGTRKKGHQRVGYGMATGVWEAMQQKSSAKAHFSENGELTVSSGTADIGTGTYTVMTQIAAETFGIELAKVHFKLGDSDLPEAPIEGGSWTVSSVGSAVKKVCEQLKKTLFQLAQTTYPDRFQEEIFEFSTFKNGSIQTRNNASIDLTDLLKAAGKSSVDVLTASEAADERDNYSCYAHSCVMVEVNIDEDLGMIRVPRVVNAVAGGRIINPKTAESQLLGGTTWGIGMALEEEGMIDDRNGRIMNANLAEYHVAIQADVQDIDIIFVEEEDEIVNPLGAKGLGEIGMVGVAAAIANAVYNATGKRVRELPITLDKVINL